MTTGALVFAFNNEQTDYVAMAGWCARNIRRHLRIPVAVVTDCDPGSGALEDFDEVIYSPPVSGGTRWFEDYQNTVTWHNAARVNAYSQTPWDRTLVVDADYVVASSALSTILDADADFLCHSSAVDISTGKQLTALNHFGRYNMPMSWATVMMFRKSKTAQYVFDCMQMIRRHWQHYRDVYAIDHPTYRNDFALSIALSIVNGHVKPTQFIPWPLMTVMPHHDLAQIKTDSFELTYPDSSSKTHVMSWHGLDFHAMGKSDLEKIVESH
jgi:hypothetical protein